MGDKCSAVHVPAATKFSSVGEFRQAVAAAPQVSDEEMRGLIEEELWRGVMPKPNTTPDDD